MIGLAESLLLVGRKPVVIPGLPQEHIADGRPGRKPIPTRRVLEAVLWLLNTGAQWHVLPQSYPNYKTVHRRFQAWCRDEILRRLLRDVANEPGSFLRSPWPWGGISSKALGEALPPVTPTSRKAPAAFAAAQPAAACFSTASVAALSALNSLRTFST